MAQFDVYSNPSRHTQKVFPYIVDIQNSVISDIATRIVIPLGRLESFKWFAEIGMDEEAFRRRVYMAAVCRCFPGKNPGGGDRVPSKEEVSNCTPWLDSELKLLKSKLILPVGKLAIGQFLAVKKLNEVVGSLHQVTVHGVTVDLVPLPHPSGASTWHRTEPGKSLLMKQQAS